jgi:hypothetical protein
MQMKPMQVSGIVVEGHRVASGPSREYPYGSLERQIPFFRSGGLDLEGFFPGTLNISIVPMRLELFRPSFTFRQIAWTDLHPPEDFSFSPCRITYQGNIYEGFVYHPHPETKIRHFQDSSLIEVITKKIPGIGYGSWVKLTLDPAEIRLLKA